MRGKPDHTGSNNPLQKVVFETYGAFDPRDPYDFTGPLDPPSTNFTVEDLVPYTEYEFLVTSWNSLGSVRSNWITARTLEGGIKL